MSSKLDKTVVEKALLTLGLSGGAIRVYMFLLGSGRVSVKVIADGLAMPRPSVYDYLRELRELDMVNYLEVDNKKLVASEGGEQLLGLLKNKEREIAASAKKIENILPEIGSLPGGTEPRVKFHPGPNGPLRVLTNILMSGEKEVFALWSKNELEKRVTQDELSYFTDSLKRRNIKLNKKETGKINMSYFIYGNRVSFISSLDEGIAFTIRSQDLAKLKRREWEDMGR